MDNPQVDTDSIGSAGTLISAAMQTAAHYIQSSLLDTINTSLGSPLASFLFALAVISALFVVALGGNYKFGLWFLLGPALFFTAIIPRIPSSGVNWEFGGRVHGQRVVKEVTKGLYGENPQQTVGKVSTIFAKWDMFTSAVIQALITSTQLINTKADLEFITRTDRFSSLFRLQIGDARLQTFINVVVLDECASYLSLQHARFHSVGSFKREDIEKQLKGLEKRVVISSQDENYHLIQGLHKSKYFGEDAPALKDTYTCPDLWDLATRALKIEAQSLIFTVSSANTGDKLTPIEIQHELAKKFESVDGKTNSIEEKMDIMLNAVAVRLFYDAMARFPKNHAHLNLRRDLRTPLADGHFGISEKLRYLADNFFQDDVKGQYLNLMQSLPYIQGLVLYFLAITYPFFAFALVVPGRHFAALLWLGLWFWAKSWDFGFAVVMLIDELLYYLLPHGPPLTKELLADPGKAFQVLFLADPTYSVYTYYQIMATLLASVPILTGLLVKRGASEIFDVVDRGYSQFAGKMGYAFASFSRSLVAQEMAGREEGLKIEAGNAAFARSFQDPEVIKAIALGGGIKILEAVADQLTRNGEANNVVSRFLKNVGNVGVALNDNVQKQYLNYAMAKIKFNVDWAMWNQSHSEEARSLAQKAVEVGYWTHDLRQPAPDLMGLLIAHRAISSLYGGATAGAVDRALRQAVEETFSLRPS